MVLNRKAISLNSIKTYKNMRNKGTWDIFLNSIINIRKSYTRHSFLQFLPERIKLKNCNMLLGNFHDKIKFAVNKRNLKQVFKQWFKTTNST